MSTSKKISTIESLSDEELLQLFANEKKQSVLATLYLRYYDLAYGVALKYLSDAELAKDAVMDVYTELLRKLPGQDVRNFKSWLYVFVKNHCLMQLRKGKKMLVDYAETENIMQSAHFLHHEEENEKETILKKLEDCVKTLPGEQKETVKLFYLQNKSYKEVAEKTGNDWNKVRSLIQNGRRNLKNCMEKNED